MIKNKIEFTVTVDGKECRFAVRKPTAAQANKAKIAEARMFREAVAGGAILREKLTDFMVEQGMLSEAKRKDLEEIQKRLEVNGRKVPDERGRVKEKGVTKEQAKQAALAMLVDRSLLQEMSVERVALDSRTAQSLAENARFDCLVSLCTVHADAETADQPVFASTEEYQERAARDDAVANRAATLFAHLERDLDPEWRMKLPEMVYLKSIQAFGPETEAVSQEEETYSLEDDAGVVGTVPTPPEAVEAAAETLPASPVMSEPLQVENAPTADSPV